MRLFLVFFFFAITWTGGLRSFGAELQDFQSCPTRDGAMCGPRPGPGLRSLWFTHACAVSQLLSLALGSHNSIMSRTVQCCRVFDSQPEGSGFDPQRQQLPVYTVDPIPAPKGSVFTACCL